jgi:hypothetical protein
MVAGPNQVRFYLKARNEGCLIYIFVDVWWYNSCSKWLILKRRDVGGGGSLVRGLVKDLDLTDIIFICRRSFK